MKKILNLDNLQCPRMNNFELFLELRMGVGFLIWVLQFEFWVLLRDALMANILSILAQSWLASKIEFKTQFEIEFRKTKLRPIQGPSFVFVLPPDCIFPKRWYTAHFFIVVQYPRSFPKMHRLSQFACILQYATVF